MEELLEALIENLDGLVEAVIEFPALRPPFAGAVAGLLSVWPFPQPLLAAWLVIPGASIVLAPLLAGFALHLLRNRLRVATFRVGATFAFPMALVRWWLVARPH